LYPNLRSNQQMAKFWFDDMKLVGHGRSTNKANRDRMLVHPGTTDTHAELIHLYNDFATDTKFLSTYLNSKVDPDGRIRCEYRQWGVQSAPGRLSSAQVMWGSGMNLQNQPEKAYHMFVSDPGYMFTYFDLSQAEARIVAYQWKVNGLIESFERAKTDNSFDVHRGNAERIFRMREKLEKSPLMSEDLGASLSGTTHDLLASILSNPALKVEKTTTSYDSQRVLPLTMVHSNYKMGTLDLRVALSLTLRLMPSSSLEEEPVAQVDSETVLTELEGT